MRMQGQEWIPNLLRAREVDEVELDKAEERGQGQGGRKSSSLGTRGQGEANPFAIRCMLCCVAHFVPVA